MTDKQKQAILLLNKLKIGGVSITEEEYFLLLDFIVGIPEPTINIPFQRSEPYCPYETWINTNENITHTSTPFDPQRNYEPDGRFGKVTCTDASTSITDTMKAKDKELSYGEKLIKEGRSPI